MLTVYTLLYCRANEDKEGNFIFFDSVRKGFPNAQINVYSNANSKEFNKKAKSKCESIDANFIELKDEIQHYYFIEHILNAKNKPFYIIDPDTVWFDEMPLKFDADIAGRYIPNFYDKYSDTNTFSRLHTSCLYVNPVSTKEHLAQTAFSGEINLIKPTIFYLNKIRFRHDTCSSLYHFLKAVVLKLVL